MNRGFIIPKHVFPNQLETKAFEQQAFEQWAKNYQQQILLTNEMESNTRDLPALGL
jgi:Fe-S cluster biosynthesis and repair protein YggX